jgi:hypothetical protein
MAGAELDSIPSLSPDRRAAVHGAIGESFTSVFRVALIACACLAIAAAFVGFLIR